MVWSESFLRFFDPRNYPRYLNRVIIASIKSAVDEKKFHRFFPDFHIEKFVTSDEKENVSEVYNWYVRQVSHFGMAVSFELAVFLLSMCRYLRAVSILDLGSGFSSYIFNYYRQVSMPSATIISVDDSKEWLKKTREFLSTFKMQSDQFLIWPDNISEIEGKKFDIVLHDLGDMNLRKATFDNVLQFINPITGVAILDDIHIDLYRMHVVKVMKSKKHFKLLFLKAVKDRFGRYPAIVFAPDKRF